MKKKVSLILTILLCMVITISGLVACTDESGYAKENASNKSYVIQYTDDTGTYTIDVKQGSPYSMEVVPTREGYEFLGLFDAEVGGTQYVNSKGSSLSSFSDGKNLVLFPQFKAKEYTLALDYQGAAVTGEREVTVSYGSKIASLPTNVTYENKKFMGWYTEPNRGGIQVADQYGVIPTNSIITPDIFDLTDPNGFIRLYAGFQGEMRTITLYISENAVPEEVEIEHGTPVTEVGLDLRVDGKAVISWSLKPNDTEKTEIFNGKVTSDMVLYAAEYAPVIDFDSQGGKDVNPIVARAGSSISLPVPQRENYQFAGWYTTGGSKYTATAMPSDSVKLNAKWTPMLIFDERGGTLVEDIAAEQGTKVTLPTTEKDGYMFSGWYTEQGEVYTATAMPEFSTKLVAKYHKTIQKIYSLMQEDDYGRLTVSKPTFERDLYFNILDLSELFDNNIRQISITAHYKGRYIWSNKFPDITYIYMNYYTQQIASDGYKVWEYSDSFQKNDENFHKFSHSTNLTLSSPKLYIAKYVSHYSTPTGSSYHGEVVDFWVEVEYPDMSKLY